jgi:UTP--glucose-1-phosphate uridylyltransferase
VKDEPFLHFVGDHIYVGSEVSGSAKRLVEAACSEGCAISAVQVTRENLLPFFGTVGGQPVPGKAGFYRVDTVLEKPTPTEAEQRLIVPGLRSGQYLCFYGMHVLTPTIFEILSTMLQESATGRTSLSSALAVLSQQEQYGLFTAQLALAMNGQDRAEVLTQLIQILATRNLLAGKGA